MDIKSVFCIFGFFLFSSVALSAPPECRERGAPPQCFEKTIEDFIEIVEEYSARGEPAPDYVREYFAKKLEAGDPKVTELLEKSSNPMVCCQYSCGYTGCKYSRVRASDCRTVGGSSTVASRCR